MVRLRRGQLLSDVDRLILVWLVTHESGGHAYRIAQALDREQGTIAGSLRRMAERGYVARQGGAEAGYPPRRVYRATEAGKAVLAKETG